jgi:hypothetical protein
VQQALRGHVRRRGGCRRGVHGRGNCYEQEGTQPRGHIPGSTQVNSPITRFRHISRHCKRKQIQEQAHVSSVRTCQHFGSRTGRRSPHPGHASSPWTWWQSPETRWQRCLSARGWYPCHLFWRVAARHALELTMHIKGTVALLVTGANRGLGKSFVEALLAQGAAKVHAAMRTPSTGQWRARRRSSRNTRETRPESPHA